MPRLFHLMINDTEVSVVVHGVMPRHTLDTKHIYSAHCTAPRHCWQRDYSGDAGRSEAWTGVHNAFIVSFRFFLTMSIEMLIRVKRINGMFAAVD